MDENVNTRINTFWIKCCESHTIQGRKQFIRFLFPSCSDPVHEKAHCGSIGSDISHHLSNICISGNRNARFVKIIAHPAEKLHDAIVVVLVRDVSVWVNVNEAFQNAEVNFRAFVNIFDGYFQFTKIYCCREKIWVPRFGNFILINIKVIYYFNHVLFVKKNGSIFLNLFWAWETL